MNAQTDYRYDVFISYTEADRAWVEGYLHDALTQAGVRCHLEAAFALGVPRVLEFERAVQQSQRTLLVLSPAYLADSFSQFTDLLAQSYGLETSTWPVIPLRLHSIELPPRLAMLTALNATDAADWPRVIERLCAELQRPVPGPAPRPACPYPGMVPFSAQDAHFFYGREAEIKQMLQHLRLQRYLFVIGPSGSGKSSLVFAGLLPSLLESSYFPPGFWLIRGMRPGAGPLQALTQAIGGEGGDPAWPVGALASLLAANPPAQRLLLVIDQFEELFTQAERAEQSRFITVLKALQVMENCALLIAMRADFFPDLMNSDLWPVHAFQRLEIAPLRGEALRQAIQQPAADVGAYLEAGLLERLLADAANEPGTLPLLQETMVLLWGEMQRRLLPLIAYKQLGSEGSSGLGMAIAMKAEARLADLSSVQQAIARRIFVRLVQFGEGRADTRRQQSVAALRSAGDDRWLFDQTLRHLTDNRLLTLSGEEKGTDKTVDIAHEALIAGWRTLQQWLAERREAEQTRRRLEDKAQEWVHLGGSSGGLLDSVELREAEQWLAHPDASELGHSDDLAALVQASRAAVERDEQEKEAARQRELAQAQALAAEQRRRAIVLQRLLTILGVLSVVVMGVGLYTWYQRNAKEQQRQIAVARQLAAQASLVRYQQANLLQRSVLLAVEAMKSFPSLEAYLPLRQSLGLLLRPVKNLPHENGMYAVSFSPDGQFLATGSYDKIARLWELPAGER